jgi:hypothetical protein
MAQKDADHLLAHGDSLETDWPFVAFNQREQARTVRRRLLAGQVAHRHFGNPDRDRLRVIEVVRFRNQEGSNSDSHAPGTGDASKVVLIVRLTNDFEVRTAAEDLGTLGRRRRGASPEPEKIIEFPHRLPAASLARRTKGTAGATTRRSGRAY